MIERLKGARPPMVCIDFGRDQLSAVEVVDGAITRWISRALPDDALRGGDPILPGYVAEALVLDAGARRLHATLLVTGQPSYVDEVVVGTVVHDLREALDRLLQRAYRHQSTASGSPGRLAPVLLAGDLEYAELSLPVAG